LTLETESSDVGGVASSKQIEDLPLALGGVGALRAPEAFVFLQPATTGPGSANSNNGVFLSKIAGGQNYGNEVLLDGASQERSENGSSFDEESPSVEALQEFKVTTSLPEAEFGRTTGGVEDFAVRSGGNSYHGTGFELLRNQALDANTYFNNGFRALNCPGSSDPAACDKSYATPFDHKNDFGGTFSGPVRIPHIYKGSDKTFFLFAWEQLKYTTSSTQTVTVPTMAERGGNFADRLTTTQVGTDPCTGMPIYNGEIFDPATTRTVNANGGTTECRTPFQGNMITTGRISKVATALLNYYPLPTTNTVTNNYVQNGVAPITDTTYSVRIDDNVTSKLKVYGSYNTRENALFTSGVPSLPTAANPEGYYQNFTAHLVRIGADYQLRPNLLNVFVFGVNRTNSQNFSTAATIGSNWASLLGLGNTAPSRNFPLISTGDAITNLGNGDNDDNIDNGFRLNDAVNWTHGRNNFKFGTDVRAQQYSPINGNNPYLNFGAGQTAGALGQGGGLGFASLELGEATGGGQNVPIETPRWTSWYYAFFVQDDLKLTKNLTLNLGVRYDVDVPRKEAHNDTSNFSPTALDPELGIPGALVFGSTCKGCNTRWANTWYKDIAPRVGFAWSPDFLHGRTVIRGGAGIIYGPLVYDDFGGSTVTGYTVNPSNNSPNGFDPSFQIDAGFPAYTPPPNLDPGFYNGQPLANSWIVPSAGRPAMVDNWNLQIQHQLADDLIATVGYIGNHAQDLESNLLNPNNMPISDFALADALYQPFNGNSAGVPLPFPKFLQNWGGNPALQQALRPFPQYDFIDQGCCLENVGMSSFNALTATLQRHFKDGINTQISYTWSKTFTDADSALPNHGVGVAQDQNVFDLHQEKALSAQDIPQQLVLSGLYEFPAGKGKRFFNHGIESQVLGGWELGTVWRFQSGQPLSFGCASGIPGFENCIRFDREPGASLKSAVYKKGSKALDPFVIVPPGGSVDPNRNTMFNLEYNDVTQTNSPVPGAPIAFYDPNGNYARDCSKATLANCNSAPDQPYRLGGVGLPRTTGEIRTPAYVNNDLSVLKRFPIRENLNFSLKAEFLNTFNQHTFSIPDLEPYDYGTFGLPSGTVNTPRNIQFTGRFNF
jgi:hypothetical protein